MLLISNLVKKLEEQLSSKNSFAVFCNLITLTLNQNSVKDLRFPKVSKKLSLEGSEVSQNKKKRFPEASSHKKSETNSSFHWKRRTTGKVQFLFSRSLLLLLLKTSFLQRDRAIKFKHFPGIPQFPQVLSVKSFPNS